MPSPSSGLPVAFCWLSLVAPVAGQERVSVFETFAEPRPSSAVDAPIFAVWKKKGLVPARPCSDAVFVRRVFLDLIGRLPEPRDVVAFCDSSSPNKHRDLVRRLLDRPEFATYWAMRWSDVLRIRSEFPINLWPNAAHAYHRWIEESLARNVGYDRFARALLTSSGSNFRVPPVNFYRALQKRDPESIAAAVALTFLGERIEHWPEAKRKGFAAFFARVSYKRTKEWKEEIVYDDPTREVGEAVFPDGTRTQLGAEDPRRVFADWLIRPDNPYFAKAFVNRVWAWIFGRGVVHEPDDIRPDNPPAVPGLLDALAKDFVASGYDVKHLLETITASSVYRLSCVPRCDPGEGARVFAYYPPRRLEAEVLIDAIDQVTGTGESYSSAIPEPYTYVPSSLPSAALYDASVTSSFLELFGRPARATGLMSERDDDPSAAQCLHLLNSTHVLEKLENGPGLRDVFRPRRREPPDRVIERLYLKILSRRPTPEELRVIADHVRGAQGRRLRDRAIDIAWALLNSSEFLFRH